MPYGKPTLAEYTPVEENPLVIPPFDAVVVVGITQPDDSSLDIEAIVPGPVTDSQGQSHSPATMTAATVAGAAGADNAFAGETMETALQTGGVRKDDVDISQAKPGDHVHLKIAVLAIGARQDIVIAVD